LRVTELRKAWVRLPLLVLLTCLVPGMAGGWSTALWVLYAVVAVFYSLWGLRLALGFPQDRRLGRALCVTDMALILPLLIWGPGSGLRVLIFLIWTAGVALTCFASQACVRAERSGDQSGRTAAEAGLDQALRSRLKLFTACGARFGLVMLRIIHFDAITADFGVGTAAGICSLLARRGLRLLGPDAQAFPLPGGRVAFVFEIEPLQTGRRTGPGRSRDSYDVSSTAMGLGHKACERPLAGRRVVCSVGWASVPGDGLSADSLLSTAVARVWGEETSQSVGGAGVRPRPVPESTPQSGRVVPVVPEEPRKAVG
jgi:GGDEF domain-containing protein